MLNCLSFIRFSLCHRVAPLFRTFGTFYELIHFSISCVTWEAHPELTSWKISCLALNNRCVLIDEMPAFFMADSTLLTPFPKSPTGSLSPESKRIGISFFQFLYAAPLPVYFMELRSCQNSPDDMLSAHELSKIYFCNSASSEHNQSKSVLLGLNLVL